MTRGITRASSSRQEWQISQIMRCHQNVKTSMGTTLPHYKTKWTIRATDWLPQEWTRPPARPTVRLRDDLVCHLGPAWPRNWLKTDASGSNPGRGGVLLGLCLLSPVYVSGSVYVELSVLCVSVHPYKLHKEEEPTGLWAWVYTAKSGDLEKRVHSQVGWPGKACTQPSRVTWKSVYTTKSGDLEKRVHSQVRWPGKARTQPSWVTWKSAYTAKLGDLGRRVHSQASCTPAYATDADTLSTLTFGALPLFGMMKSFTARDEDSVGYHYIRYYIISIIMHTPQGVELVLEQNRTATTREIAVKHIESLIQGPSGSADLILMA